MRAPRSPDRTQTTAGAISHRRPDRTYSTPSWCEPDRRPSARPIRRSGRSGSQRDGAHTARLRCTVPRHLRRLIGTTRTCRYVRVAPGAKSSFGRVVRCVEFSAVVGPGVRSGSHRAAVLYRTRSDCGAVNSGVGCGSLLGELGRCWVVPDLRLFEWFTDLPAAQSRRHQWQETPQ